MDRFEPGAGKDLNLSKAIMDKFEPMNGIDLIPEPGRFESGAGIDLNLEQGYI